MVALPFVSEIRLFLAVLASAISVLTCLALAAFAHDRRRRSVPIRIHVAGSRGKTTTTRLIGAALRAAGHRVLVKTTGTDPTLILPDGSERAWLRWGPPTISEQTRFFREASRQSADVVVLECMAIEPEYLWASEHYLVRATHAVITNARRDHTEVVGSHPLAAARALSLAIPKGQKLFVGEEAAVDPILARAANQDCAATIVPTAGMHHDEANRAMALAVCTALGVTSGVAASAFEHAGADLGAFFIARSRINGRPFRFANAFSCNDPKSLEQLWLENPADVEPVILFNTRSDRPERTREFLATLAALRPAAQLYLVGFVPRRWTRAAGLADARVHRLATTDARSVLSTLSAATQPGATIWGVGNYSRLGRDIVRLLKGSAETCLR